MAKKINITAQLNAATTDGILADAGQIFDAKKGKFQEQVNEEFEGRLVVADGEDLVADGNVLRLKDRPNTDGMGYVILRKDKTFQEQVTKPNTIYEIRYDFDLGRQELPVVLDTPFVLPSTGGAYYRTGDHIDVEAGMTVDLPSGGVLFDSTLSAIIPAPYTPSSKKSLYVGKLQSEATLGQSCVYSLHKEVVIPENCVLKFEGGSLWNGTVKVNNTKIIGLFKNDNLQLKGTLKDYKFNIKDFGAVGDGITDDAPSIRKALSIIKQLGGGTLYIPKGTYFLNSGDPTISSWGFSEYACFAICDNLEVVGDGESSVLLYNCNRIPKHATGDVKCGRVFAALEGSNNMKINGKIYFHNFKVEYNTPTLIPGTGADYSDGQFISIYRPYNDFYKEYLNTTVIIEDMCFYNLVGHQTINCCGVDTFIARNNKHINVGKTTDPNNLDYSVYYTNVYKGIFHNNIFNTLGTSIETHNVIDEIYNNVFELTKTAYILTGAMINPNSNTVQNSLHRFYNNNLYRVESNVVAPFFYDNTKITELECFNNHIILNSEKLISRYIFPQTDAASEGKEYIGIEKVYIHNEYIKQDNKNVPATTLYNRIFRNTNIENLIIENCYLKDLSCYPLLVYDNHGYNMMKSVIFSNNTLDNCGKEVSFIDEYSDNAFSRQCIVATYIDKIYDGRSIKIDIKNNNCKGLNPLTTIFYLRTQDSTNNNTDVIDLDICVKNNSTDLGLKYPVSLVNYCQTQTIKNKSFDFVVDFYDNTIQSIIIYIASKFKNEYFTKTSRLRFYFNDTEYYEVNYNSSDVYKISGYAPNTSRDIGYVPKGSIIHSNTNIGDIYYAIVGGAYPKWINMLYNALTPDEMPTANNVDAGLSFYDKKSQKPVWMSARKYILADGYNSSLRRIGEEDLRPSSDALTTEEIGLSYYNKTKKRIEYFDGLGWTDALGNYEHQKAGTWSMRPNADGSFLDNGFQYFLLESEPDEDPDGNPMESTTGNGKPIWWIQESRKWVDATGATVTG